MSSTGSFGEGVTGVGGEVDVPDPRWFFENRDWSREASGLAIRVGDGKVRQALEVEHLPARLSLTISPEDHRSRGVSRARGELFSVRPVPDEWTLKVSRSVVVEGRVRLGEGAPWRNLAVDVAYGGVPADLDATGRFAIRLSRGGPHDLGLRWRGGGGPLFPLVTVDTVDADATMDLGEVGGDRLVSLMVEVVDGDGHPVPGVECVVDPDPESTLRAVWTDLLGRAWMLHPRPIERLRVKGRDDVRWVERPGPRVRVELR